MSKACPNEIRLLQFLRGELAESESQLLDDHISSCAECETVLERLNGTPGGMLGLAIEVLAPIDQPADVRLPEVYGYRVLELVGSGGMGLVYRAFHAKLDRILALKVLQPRLANHPECRERFEQEARLNARLQHPGIVPVHETGLTEDGRPFFSMRLVGGQTLEERLMSEVEGDQDLPALLRIFQAVCEGLAYAHSNRVIHRDLKPANIMVGDFGEVQIMDWGLAKTLNERAPETTIPESLADLLDDVPDWQTRRALGTYAYMPPEQARAEVNLQDERSDVFSLGAILCHLLTGSPPYSRSEQQLLRTQAESALLDEARQRLDVCGADPELIALCKECLSPRREDRPRSASEVASRIQKHQSDKEIFRQKQQVDSATVAVERREGQKRRTLWRALFGTAIALMVIAAVAGWRHYAAKVQRERELAEQLDRQGNVLERAQKALSGKDWVGASAALKQIELDWLDATSPTLSTRARQAERDLKFALALENLQERRLELMVNPSRATDYFHDVANTFRDHGFDVLMGESKEVSGRIRESRINSTIVEGLDRWCELLKPIPLRERLARIASMADPHPSQWKLAARDSATWQSREALRKVVEATPWGDASPSLVTLLAWQTLSQGRDASSYLKRAQREFPSDFWINTLLGKWIAGESSGWKRGKGSPANAVGFFRAALAARPKSAIARTNLAVALVGCQEHSEAQTLFEEANRLLPDNYLIHFNLGVLFDEDRKSARAVEELQRAIQLNPQHSTSYYRLGVALEHLGRSDEAAAAYRESAKIDPNHADVWLGIGNTALFKRDWPAAIAAYRKSVSLDDGSATTYVRLSTALQNAGDLKGAITAARKAVAIQPDIKSFTSLANVLKASGDSAEAAEYFNKAKMAPR